MAILTFDTLKFANNSKRWVCHRNMPKRKPPLCRRRCNQSKELATKEDLKSGFKDLEMKLGNRFEKLMGEKLVLKWMLGILIAGVISLVLKAYF